MGSSASKMNEQKPMRPVRVPAPHSCPCARLITGDGALTGDEDAQISLLSMGSDTKTIAVALKITTIKHIKRLLQSEDGVCVWQQTVHRVGGEQEELEDNKTLAQSGVISGTELMLVYNEAAMMMGRDIAKELLKDKYGYTNAQLKNSKHTPGTVVSDWRNNNSKAKDFSQLHVAAMKVDTTDGDEISALIALGSDVHAKGGRNGSSALHRSATVAAAQALLSAGAIVDDSNYWGWTPLMYVCGGGNPVVDRAGVAETLLASGAAVNARNNRGMTALHMVAGKEEGSATPPEAEATALVAVLLAAGADTALLSNHGRTALALALASNRQAVAAALQQEVPRRSFFSPASELQDLRSENARLRALLEEANARIGQMAARNGQKKKKKAEGETESVASC